MKIEITETQPDSATAAPPQPADPAAVARQTTPPVDRHRLRRERGLVGLAAYQLGRAAGRVRRILFGEHTPATIGRIRTVVVAATGAAWRFCDRTIWPRLRRLPRRTAIALAALAAIAVVAAGVLLSGDRQTGDKQTDTAGTARRPAVLERGNPEFRTLLPAGKSAEQLGGWTRISPPDRDAVYAYVDHIGSIRITVSQQRLPADFKRDTDDAVSDLASGYSAKETVEAAGATVHIGTSTKGPQSVIFARDDLLVLIKSDAPVAAKQWADYVSSLR